MATSISSRPWQQHYPPGVPTSIDYREAPLYSLLEDAAAAHPDLPAVRFYATRLNYAQLWAQVQQFAAVLAGLGVTKGDRVALMLPNCPQYVIAYYGTLRAGGVVAQINPLYTPRELEHLLRDSGAETIVWPTCSIRSSRRSRVSRCSASSLLL
jgi:long-chain acyl-CoA synthetase